MQNWTPLHHAVFRNDLAQTGRLLAQESVDPNVLTLVRPPPLPSLVRVFYEGGPCSPLGKAEQGSNGAYEPFMMGVHPVLTVEQTHLALKMVALKSGPTVPASHCRYASSSSCRHRRPCCSVSTTVDARRRLEAVEELTVRAVR